MQSSLPLFKLSYQGQLIRVQPRMVGRDKVYVLHFADKRQPLVLTLGKTEEGGTFWTSIPEGRQQEADVFGPMIAAHEPVMKAAHQQTIPTAKPLRLFD